jgi:tetratricopeptide (TPR) repeat protein
MIREDYMVEQVKRLFERLDDVRQRIRKGGRAKEHDELQEILGEAEILEKDQVGDAREVQVLLGHIHGELGMLSLTVGDHVHGREHLLRALAIVEPLVAGDDEKVRYFYPSLLLNAGTAAASQRDLDTALSFFTRALQAGDAARQKGPEQAKGLVGIMVAARQNRATVNEQRRAFDEAIADIQAVRQLSAVGVSKGDPAAISAAIELTMRLSHLHRRASHQDEAFKEAQNALQAADALVHKDAKQFAATYIRAKLGLAETCFWAGQFGKGENHLFEVIDSAPNLIDTVLVGLDFYAGLWGFSDEKLEQGGLPRDEVQDSFAELLAKLDARCSDALIKELCHARFDLLVNDSGEAAQLVRAKLAGEKLNAIQQALLAKLEKSMSPPA